MEGLTWVLPLIRDNALSNILTLIGVIIVVNERRIPKAVQHSNLVFSIRRTKNTSLCNRKLRGKKLLRGKRGRTPLTTGRASKRF
jgi:hypothetical protein